jgi:hypothetical protein
MFMQSTDETGRAKRALAAAKKSFYAMNAVLAFMIKF